MADTPQKKPPRKDSTVTRRRNASTQYLKGFFLISIVSSSFLSMTDYTTYPHGLYAMLFKNASRSSSSSLIKVSMISF